MHTFIGINTHDAYHPNCLTKDKLKLQKCITLKFSCLTCKWKSQDYFISSLLNIVFLTGYNSNQDFISKQAAKISTLTTLFS